MPSSWLLAAESMCETALTTRSLFANLFCRARVDSRAAKINGNASDNWMKDFTGYANFGYAKFGYGKCRLVDTLLEFDHGSERRHQKSVRMQAQQIYRVCSWT